MDLGRDTKGLGDETRRWLEALRSPREVIDIELTGMIASIAHLAYHLGAIRQINKSARGPKEGTLQPQRRHISSASPSDTARLEALPGCQSQFGTPRKQGIWSATMATQA